MALGKLSKFVIVGICILSSMTTAHATTARLSALGMGPDWVPDERESIRWYASGVDHSGVAAIDMGRIDAGGGAESWNDRISGRGGSVHVRFDEQGRWGVGSLYFQSEAVQSAPSQVFAGYPGGSITMLYARKVGALDLGAGFRGTSYRENDFSDQWGSTGRGEYRHDWGLGIRWRISENLRWEVAGEMREVEFGYYQQNRGLNAYEKSSDNFSVRTRLRIVLSKSVVLVPLFDYTRDLHTIYSSTLADVADLDGWQMRTGFVFQIHESAATRFFFGAEYTNGKENHESLGGPYRLFGFQERDWFSIHARAAVEVSVASWLTVRASTQYLRVDDETTFLQQTRSLPDALEWQGLFKVGVTTPVGLGFTAAVDQFRFDVSYNDQAPLSIANIPDANLPRETGNFATFAVRYLF